MDRPPRPTVLYPAEWSQTRPSGTLYGYYHPSTGFYNLVACGDRSLRPARGVPLGALAGAEAGPAGGPGTIDLQGRFDGDRLVFTAGGRPCSAEPYALLQDVFSRNQGVLESSRLLDCCAVISGCGSVGSQVALELARAGVGRFLLADNDILSYHNLCRHQCGIPDVGRRKTEAVRDRILDVNPSAEVRALPTVLEEVPPEEFEWACGAPRGAVLVGCADNRQADLYANRIACIFRAPFVSIGLWERAFAGEVFWGLPGRTPCYYCVFGTGDHALSYRPSVNRRVYTTEEDLSAVRFEPGISVDLSWVTSIGIKFVLDLLSRDAPGYRPRLLGALSQFTLACNTTDPRVGGVLAGLFEHPLQVTRSIDVQRLEGCPHCRLASEGAPLSPEAVAPEVEAASDLVGYFTADPGPGFRRAREFSNFLLLRWGLNDAQRDRCRRRADDAPANPGLIGPSLEAARTRLTDGDRAVLAALLRWFLDDPGDRTDGPLAEVPDRLVGRPLSAEVPLFPGDVLCAFEAIQIEPTLDQDHMLQEFRRLVRRLHPDAISGAEPTDEVKRRSAELTSRLIEARKSLESFYRGLAAGTRP